MMKKMNHNQDRCDFCGVCVGVCPHDAIELREAELIIIDDRCTRCGQCVQACPIHALEVNDEAGL
jgi:NAD-dependent dihydropyrimidine dehydrogenase PreA subunit